jgi:acyl carrier protein
MLEGLKDRLKAFIACDLVGNAGLTIDDDEDLLLSGLVDSLGVIRLITFVKEEMRIHVPPGDVTLENFGTIGAMTEYLSTRASAA